MTHRPGSAEALCWGHFYTIPCRSGWNKDVWKAGKEAESVHTIIRRAAVYATLRCGRGKHPLRCWANLRELSREVTLILLYPHLSTGNRYPGKRMVGSRVQFSLGWG